MKPQTVFQPADILLPKEGNLTQWSVVACDQYTSQPEYWEEAEKIVGNAPSTLRLTLPELYLDQPDTDQRIAGICNAMKEYLADNLFQCYPHSCIYLERTLADGRVRKGLVGCIDLECYDYHKGACSPVRATEGTVMERIPPRLRVRKDALLELPHIMMLLDDPEQTVIEPLSRKTANLKKAYDFTLMQNSGSIKGWVASGEAYRPVAEALDALADSRRLDTLYGSHEHPLLFAVGDGNHSLATAKEAFELIKQRLPQEQWERHPARWALVELVNLHDSALVFEPIHRAVFQVNPDALLSRMKDALGAASEMEPALQKVHYITAAGEGDLYLTRPCSQLTVGSLQQFLDDELAEHGGRVDYIHGDQVAADLGRQPGCISFLLPPMEKSQLFPTVMADGALPRKPFSMGHACDKRFYLEARKVR